MAHSRLHHMARIHFGARLSRFCFDVMFVSDVLAFIADLLDSFAWGHGCRQTLLIYKVWGHRALPGAGCRPLPPSALFWVAPAAQASSIGALAGLKGSRMSPNPMNL